LRIRSSFIIGATNDQFYRENNSPLDWNVKGGRTVNDSQLDLPGVSPFLKYTLRRMSRNKILRRKSIFRLSIREIRLEETLLGHILSSACNEER
jgi:hypothetical protein